MAAAASTGTSGAIVSIKRARYGVASDIERLLQEAGLVDA